MSELDVIVIHIRAEQAAEYERLFAERELPLQPEDPLVYGGEVLHAV